MQSPGMRPLHFISAGVILAIVLLFVLRAFLHPVHARVISAQTGHLPSAPATEQISPTQRIWLPHIVAPSPAQVLIAAAHIDSAVSYEPDEAILLWNVGGSAQPLAGWSLQANTRRVTFPITSTLTLGPRQRLWCTAEAASFRSSFGEAAACEWSEDSDPTVPDLDGAMTLPNGGASLQLLDDRNRVVDTLLYGDVTRSADGWYGVPAQLYTGGAIGATGQVWQRKRDVATGLPVDTDQASDWAGDRSDTRQGRQVRRPGWRGWDADDLGVPLHAQTDANTTVAVGPEGLYSAIAGALGSAVTTIDMSIYTLEHPELTAALVAASARGVAIRILLEGSPPGGISDEQRWCVAQLTAAGADVRYMAANDAAPRGYAPRYLYNHAKYLIIDNRLALVGTDNLNLDSVPLPAAEPVGGRRGYYLITDAAPVVAGLRRIFDGDWRPDLFLDLRPYTPDHPRFGAPPDDFVWPEPPVYSVAAAPFGDAVTSSGATRFLLVSAPENALHPDDGILALLARAGAGDVILVEQLYEHKHWGESTSNPIADANPRLQAIIDAARRGAQVRVLLDSFFDDGEELRSNRATVDYVRTVAAAEGLDLDARLANPTGGGIHAKVVLLRVGGETWSAVGSLNGGEISHKLNREVVLLVDSPEVNARLEEVFAWDWARGE